MLVPNKLGLHIDANQEFGDTWQVLNDTPFGAVTLLVNPNDPKKAAPSVNKIPYRLIRVYNAERSMSGTDRPGHSAAANAQMFGEAIQGLFADYPGAYWMYWRNEVGDGDDLEFHVEEMVEWIRWCSAHGVLAGIGGWSVGMPRIPSWEKIKPALAEANKSGALLALHEYGFGAMDAQVENGEGYLCLRYRKVWNQYGFSRLYPNLKLIISELGLDYDVNTGQFGPWRRLNVPVKDYLSGIVWYLNEISKDPYVVGATIYAVTSEGAWAEYNIQGDMLNAVRQFVIDNPTIEASSIPPAPIPTPDPVPAPVPGELLEPVQGFTSLNGPYSKLSANLNVPAGWTPFWNNAMDFHADPEGDPFYGLPPIARIHAGGSRLDGGLYEVVSVTPGQIYEVDVEVMAWSTNDPTAHSPGQYPMWASVGIDPDGGTDYLSPSIVWEETPHAIDNSRLFVSCRARANQNRITVFLRGKSDVAVARNDAFFSNVHLVRVVPGSTPAPTVLTTHGVPAVTTTDLNLRCGPGTTYQVKSVMTVHEPVTVLGPGNDQQLAALPVEAWLVVQRVTGEVGYCAGWFLGPQ